MNSIIMLLKLSTTTLVSLLFVAAESFAQAPVGPAAPHQPSFTEVLAKMFPMFAGVFLIFYFLVARPQQQKLKAQEQLLAALKAGDNVVTSGGIIGKVSSVADGYVTVEVAPNVKLRVEKTHIIRREEAGAKVKSAA